MSTIDLTIVITLAIGVVRLAEAMIQLTVSSIQKRRNGKNGTGEPLQAIQFLLERTERLHEQTAERMTSIATDQVRIADAMLRIERQIERWR